MMRGKWGAKTKATILLQGLNGKPGAEIYTAHQINQVQYSQWEDQLLTHPGQTFEVHANSQRQTRLQPENAKLKQLVGERRLDL